MHKRCEVLEKVEKVKRITFIEGLRMIAAICVFNTHILSTIYNITGYKENPFISYTPISLLRSGGFGVSFFFMYLDLGYIFL